MFLNGMQGFLSAIYILILFFIPFYIFVFLSTFFKHKKKISILDSGKKFIRVSSFIFSIIYLLSWTWVVYHNFIFPAYLPQYRISNGEKTVLFQGMSHIAGEKFYTKIQESLKEAKKDGFILFYEGVRGGSVENMKKFEQALGISIESLDYETIAQLFGAVAQDQNLFLGLYNSEDYNIDLDIDTIIGIYEQKFPEYKNTEISSLNIDGIGKEILSNLSTHELITLQYIQRSFLHFFTKNYTSGFEMVEDSEIFEIILGERDRFIAHRILTSDAKNIFALYGLMHFEGIFSMLQENDSRWKIIEVEYVPLFPLKNLKEK